MDLDRYPVEVLHYLNPHLIWVKASRSSDTLQQIGVHGILPLDNVIDICSGDVTKKHCVEWLPAAATIMKKVFLEAKEVWFHPTYIDRRSTIFDNNIHIYGELLIMKTDGKYRKLSSYLTKSGVAVYNVVDFYRELSVGNIQTKLSDSLLDEVIKEIENPKKDSYDGNLKQALKKHTTVLKTAKHLEELTTENLERHNSKLKKLLPNENIMEILHRKFKDLELCKDIDEESLGRAVGLKKGRELNNPRPLKTPNLYEKYVNLKKPDDVNEIEPKKSVTECNQYKKSESDLYNTRVDKVEPKINKRTNKKPPKTKIPSYNAETELRIAYCPPDIDRSKLPLRVVPKEKLILDVPITITEQESLEVKDYDMFGDMDSEVDFEITHKNTLKEYRTDEENSINDNDLPQNRKFEDKKPLNKEESKSEFSKDILYREYKDKKQSLSDVSSVDLNSVYKSKTLSRKFALHKQKTSRNSNSFLSSCSDTTTKDTNSTVSKSKKQEDSDEEIDKFIQDLKSGNVTHAKIDNQETTVQLPNMKINVNPYKNLDPNLSVFVDKLVTPVLMLHTKNNNRIEPKSNLSDIPFNSHIHMVLKNMNVTSPMTIQSVSWFTILRGNSLLLIGPPGSGKTMGYLPSVCRLISDLDNDIVNSVGPTCIIVCATARAVSDVERKCKMFLSPKERVFSCYAGMDVLSITTSLLNGCDLFICTPCVLARLLFATDFGLDLRRLTTLVLDDCERLDETYKSEVKVALFKVKDMLKNRANKEVKVQYILASRVWCDFMEPLAKKVPNSVVCIGAFQECVLYSKAQTTVEFVKSNKTDRVLNFLAGIDKTKKTVVVCRSDKEVELLERLLVKQKYVVFSCDSRMAAGDLQSLNKSWDEYTEPIAGPILVCCDSNLTHLNITDAHHLLHYSMPNLFSMFCKRFSVLNDNFDSIFKTKNNGVSIKILLEDTNAEQLPKICNFVKRCTKEFPNSLDSMCHQILSEKDKERALNLVPICDNLLEMGECPDFWYCKVRHTSDKEADKPEDWMPVNGIITFKILHYHSAVLYSARLLSNIQKGETKKYPQTYSKLSINMGYYFSQDSNKMLHGVPKLGDVCAVSIKQNFFVRCIVVKIINKYKTGNPNHVLIKFIDEERFETTRDIYLYHLPKEFKDVETHVVQVRLAGIMPKDKDVTFSDLAKHQLKKDIDKDDDLYMRGKVVFTVGNCVFVDNIDACQDLTSLNEVVVKHNFKEILEPHSEPFPDHISKLKACLYPQLDSDDNTNTDETTSDLLELEVAKVIKSKPKIQWAHLGRDDLSLVYFTSAVNPGCFFIRLTKFEETMTTLVNDINKYVEGEPEPLQKVEVHDIVLALFPDDQCYERARIDSIIDENKLKCFFVDNGDWRDIPMKHLLPIPEHLITYIPFQAIECRLVGIKPFGEEWTEFSTNWLCDQCLDGVNLKNLYVQYFSVDKAEFTDGQKYAVALIDTNGENDIIYNYSLIDLNLAQEDKDEIGLLDKLDFVKQVVDDWEKPDIERESPCLNEVLPKQLIRSVPLVDDDDSDSDKWSVNLNDDFVSMLKPEAGKPVTNNFVADLPRVLPASKVDSDSDVSIIKIETNGSRLSEYEMLSPPPKEMSLDSDDLSTAEMSNTEIVDKQVIIDEGRKPKLLWRQNKTSVSIKVMLIGAEDYEVTVLDRTIKFSSTVNDTFYAFELELYGVLDKSKCTHSYKGQYILIKLTKLMKRNWLTLTKESGIMKWIVYDVDSIDTSSDEEVNTSENLMAEIVKKYHKVESDSDDDFCDDANFSYTH